jgi:serine/threonine protein phosphatase PrpC
MTNNNAWITEIFSGRLPKENEKHADCQDFYRLDQKGRFAIADGASQSFYSNIWAKKLVDHFCEDPHIDGTNWERWLQPIQKSWFLDVKKKVSQAREDNKPTWVTNQNRLKFGECATSTFIGLEFIDSQVRISVVGDSYLFILKEKHLIATCPAPIRADEFGDRPEYLASDKKNNHFLPVLISYKLNDTDPQMHFILATDALSEYIFRCHAREEDIFSILLSISNIKQFHKFISKARHSQKVKLKNDDVALVVLRVSSENKGNKFVYLKPEQDESHNIDRRYSKIWYTGQN